MIFMGLHIFTGPARSCTELAWPVRFFVLGVENLHCQNKITKHQRPPSPTASLKVASGFQPMSCKVPFAKNSRTQKYLAGTRACAFDGMSVGKRRRVRAIAAAGGRAAIASYSRLPVLGNPSAE